MNKNNLLTLYILKILEKYSDSEHLLNNEKIIQYLKDIYNIEVQRNAISRALENLIELNYDIVRTSRSGCYLVKNGLDNCEMQFLVDSIYSNNCLTESQTKELIEKLTLVCSDFEKARYNHFYKSGGSVDGKNKQFFYNIDLINEAIDKKQKISFVYGRHNASKVLEPRRVERFVVNPYFFVANKCKYYLVCNYDKYSEISNFRIDLMTDIKCENEKRKEITTLNEIYKNFDKQQYINSSLYMFGSNPITAKLKLSDISGIDVVMDWFGDNSSFTQNSNGIFATVESDEHGLFFWALQYNGLAEVVYPQSLRERLAKCGLQINEKYDKKNDVCILRVI